MDEFELFGTALSSEDDAIKFLKQYGIFAKTTVICFHQKPGRKCDATMRLGKRDGKNVFICPSYKCCTSKMIRSTNTFFSHSDMNGKARNNLSPVQTIHFLYKWLYGGETVEQRRVKTGLDPRTILKLNGLCRDVYSKVLQRRSKYVGTFIAAVQIDEAYFSGWRKYNRGRLCKGDFKPKGEKQAQVEVGVGNICKYVKLGNKRDFGNRVIGPWLFGIYWSKNCVRFFVVPDRKQTTLVPIIKAHVGPSSVVVSDEWKGYSRVEKNGFVHETVCHKTNFVNPNTGYNTQAVKRAWIEGKAFMVLEEKSTVPSNNSQDGSCKK